MKEFNKRARTLFNKVGYKLFLYLTLFGLLRDYILIPLLGKLWSLALKTTPDGFITLSNLVSTLKSAPWIILIGLVLVLAYAMLGMWQISATLVAIGYTMNGQSIRMRDLLKISAVKIGFIRKPANWMILVYTTILLPLINVNQASDLVASFVIPEYIKDFIDNNTLLSVLFTMLILLLVYIALRWYYLLPSSILRGNCFSEARKESKKLTGEQTVRRGLRLVCYLAIEFLRLYLVPVCLVILPGFLVYLLTSTLEYSASLFGILLLPACSDAAISIASSLSSISLMSYLALDYKETLEQRDMPSEFVLPELETEDKPNRLRIVILEVIVSLICTVLISGGYLLLIASAQKDRNILLDYIGNTSIIAHKGYSSKAPENTMPAFELADQCKVCDYIELDVWSSADGIPVVIHNSSIKEATGVDRMVYECTYEELQKLQAPYKMDPKAFPEAKIPSLEEVLSTYAHSTPILIEIKGNKQDPELCGKIVDLMKKYDCTDTSLIQSGDYSALKAVKEIDPDISCGLILAFVTGECYQLPYADFFSIEHTFLSQKQISLIHRFGKEIFAWTVNYNESAEELRFSGIDGLITDYPDDIGAYVTEGNDVFVNVLFRNFTSLFHLDDSETAKDTYEAGAY